jgi:transposase-like protein
MKARKWTPEEIRRLAELAKGKGYSKGVLAAFVGVTPATLSVWMNPDRGELPLLSRNALMYIQNELKKLPDVPKGKAAADETDTEAGA